MKLEQVIKVWGTVLVACFLGAGVSLRASDLLTNPGFEFGQVVLPWNSYGNNVYVETSATQAHTGTNYLKVYQEFVGSENYSGVYQDNISGPGAVYSADGWAYTLSTDTIAGQNVAWLEVTFRDSSANVLALYRSALINTNTVATRAFRTNAWVDLPVTNQYNPTTVVITNHTSTLVAPAGTSFVRYQISFQGDAANSAGSVYFDDLTLAQTAGAPQGNWNIVWSDEFNGTSINTKVWTYDLGNNSGWGNNELEYYTSSSQNAYVSNGYLHIVALQQSMGGYNYTSARMKTEGLYNAEFGRIAFRASMPKGTGFWPALWMLGSNINNVSWPQCGEIDIMENKGSDLTNVQGSLHSGSDETAVYTLPGSITNSVTNFHTYLLEWNTNAIDFYVDGLLYETQTGWYDSAGAFPTPFNQPFFFIMNVAVGGNYLGNPSTGTINSNSTFPGQMVVDYVRLYNLTAPLQLSASLGNGKLSLTWPSNIVCHLEAATTNLAAATSWTNVTGATTPYSVTPNASGVFYRLASP